MPDRRAPVQKALDVFVYAPIGFAFSLRDLVPQLADKGREQVKTAVAIGQLGAGELMKRLSPSPARPAARPPTPLRPAANPASPPAPVAAPMNRPGDNARAERLAIPGYDALSASQVVPRLEGLTQQELEAVRRYEEARRGRKTVLNRIAQLQAAS